MTPNSIPAYPADLGPITVFDSRKGKELYDNYKEYRSDTMNVPPGFIGLVELFSNEEYINDTTFTLVKIPSMPIDECHDNCDIGKRYRRWYCQQSLGTTTSNKETSSKYTTYNSTIVQLGMNTFTKTIVEFEYITRPGMYYLEANRCINEVLDDCVNPTIIEFSLIPATMQYPDLTLPCDPKLEQYWPEDDDSFIASLDNLAKAISDSKS